MKIIQLNAWLGRLNGPLARFIEAEKPDIICMQEVIKPVDANAQFMDDQFGFLEEVKQAGKFEYEIFAPNWGFVFGGVILDEGSAILSHFPISNDQNKHTNGEYYVCDNNTSYRKNTRNYQTCSVELPNGQKISLVNYQGYLDGPKETGTEMTISTLQKVSDAAGKLPRPLILCGDFNAWPSSPALRVFDSLQLTNHTIEHNITGTLSSAHRAPDNDRALATCDYILTSPEIIINNFKVSDVIVSDHKALILEFNL
jgi:endonuclease/exonuclease/phosphatase family metal-dependent hydrolase